VDTLKTPLRFAVALLLPFTALGLLLLLIAGEDRVALAEAGSTRDLTGSEATVNETFYVSGSTNVLSFTVYNGSPDREWIDGITLTFPSGWTVGSAQGDLSDSYPYSVSLATSGVGTNQVSFNDDDGGNGEIHDYCSWHASIAVTVPVTAAGTQTVTWNLSGDGYGGPPHDVTGTVSLEQEVARIRVPLVFSQNRYAVIVGIADYENLVPGPNGDLNYTDDDARDLSRTLAIAGGFPPTNIRMLIDSQATKAGIRSAVIDWLAPLEQENDLVVFFFSGHGMDGGRLVPYEYNPLAPTLISDTELDAWLDALDSKNVVIAIDSCYSGDFTRGLGSTEDRAACKCIPSPFPNTLSTRDTASVLQVGQPGRLLLAACSGSQASYEFGGLQNGAFTYFLVEALQASAADTSADGWVSAEESYAYLAARVDTYVYEHTTYPHEHQNPQMDDGIPGEVALTAQ
jgi:hypothetical protein